LVVGASCPASARALPGQVCYTSTPSNRTARASIDARLSTNWDRRAGQLEALTTTSPLPFVHDKAALLSPWKRYTVNIANTAQLGTYDAHQARRRYSHPTDELGVYSPLQTGCIPHNTTYIQCRNLLSPLLHGSRVTHSQFGVDQFPVQELALGLSRFSDYRMVAAPTIAVANN
jgi:hypothetical protein